MRTIVRLRQAAKLDRVPAFMIAKLAVDKPIQVRGAVWICVRCHYRIVGAAQLGGRLIADAIDQATAGFTKGWISYR